MKGVIGHAVLLAIALVAAFFTWTARDTPETDRSLVEIWDRDPADLVQVTFQTPERTLLIERRGDRGESYLWGTETVRPPAPPPPADSAAAAATGRTAAAPATDRTAPTSANAPPPTTEQYPIGEAGDTLVKRLARLRALRDLGEARQQDLAAYGLTNSRSTVKLAFRGGGERVLTIGGTVVGGGHRYAFDRAAGRVYVLSSDLFQPLDFGGSLRLSRLFGFAPDDVHGVVLRAGSAERALQRRPASGDQPEVWSEPGSGRSDQTFANFMEQLSRLFVTRYRPDVTPGTLQQIVRADYLDARGDTLGTLELFRPRAAGPAAYFLRTRATIVPGEAYGPVAERIEQDIRTLFRGTSR